jgi:hypothetical protein
MEAVRISSDDTRVILLNTGAIPVPINTLTKIFTPYTGLLAVDNLSEGVLGREIETDTELRQRYRSAVRRIGAGTLEAMRARILQEVDGVTSVYVFENSSDITVDGRPAHSFEVVADGSYTDADLGSKIWETKPAGIVAYGQGESYLVTDSMGFSHTMLWSRPLSIPISFNIEITRFDEELFPADVDYAKQIIAEACVQYGRDTFTIGKDVIVQRFIGPVYSACPGILAVFIYASRETGVWVTDRLDISDIEVASFSTANITITVV